MIKTIIGLAGAAVAFGLAAYSVLGENDAPASEVRKGQQLGPLMVVSGVFCTSEEAALQFTKDYVAAIRKDPTLSLKAAEGVAVHDSLRNPQGASLCFYTKTALKNVYMVQPVKHRWVVRYQEPHISIRIFAFRLRHICTEESCNTFARPTFYFSFTFKKRGVPHKHKKATQEA